MLMSNQPVAEEHAADTLLLPPWRISNERYLEMIDEGVFERGGEKVELIRGMIVPMSPAGAQHHHVLAQLTRSLSPWWERGEIWVQGTMVAGSGHVYDPDLMLLKSRAGGYRKRLPRPEDVELVVEVSGSSLARDRQVKMPAYAAAGIAEYWIADLEHETLIVHRDPADDAYGRIETFRGEQSVTPLCLPDLRVAVGDLYA